MKLNMHLSSQQIITVIVAFLIGVGAALFFTRNQDVQAPTEEPVTEEDVGDAQVTDEAKPEETSKTPTSSPTTPAKTTSSNVKSSTEFVSGKCSTGLSGKKDTKLNAIVLYWSPCASEDFQLYKLVKSSVNPNPTYPADPVAFTSSNKNAANFVDRTVASRTTYYYRMCVVQRLNHINCSNVATVSF